MRENKNIPLCLRKIFCSVDHDIKPSRVFSWMVIFPFKFLDAFATVAEYSHHRKNDVTVL